jgi:hypothetical protein
MKYQITESIEENNDVDYSHMKPFTKNIYRIIQSLEVINEDIEEEGPLSEDIIDAIESLQSFMTKTFTTNIKTASKKI